MPALLERHHELLDLLVTSGRVETLRAGIVAQSDLLLSERGLWWVRRGFVRRYREARRRVLVDLHGPGAVVCRDGDRPGDAPESLVVEGGSELVAFPMSSLAELARQHPEASTLLVAGLAHHQSVLRSRLFAPPGGDGGSRLLRMLELLAVEIGAACRHGRVGWRDLPSLTHQDLADLYGCTRPHITSRLNALVAEGRLAKIRGRVTCLRTAASRSTLAAFG